MLTSLVNLVVATLTLIWQIVSNPITIAFITITASVIFFLSGFAFVTVYGMMTLAIVVLGIISIFFSPLRHLVGFIIVVGAIFYLSGKIFPSVENYIAGNFPSYKEWKTTSKQLADTKIAESTISMKKEMIASEVNKGIFGFLVEDSVAYDEFGAVLKDVLLKKGQKIMSLGLKNVSQKETPGSVGNEGMVLVSIPNVNGDFIQSRSVMVPTRKVEWDSKKEEEQKKLEKPPAVEKESEVVSSFPSRLQLRVNKPIHGDHNFQVISFDRTPTKITIRTNYKLIFEGKSVDGEKYEGKWHQSNKDDYYVFHIIFSEEFQATGKATDKDGTYSIDLKVP